MGLKKLVIILPIILLSTYPAEADPAMVGSIAKELVCQCGCTMVLSNCTHAECATREAMTTLIKQEIAQGQSAEQIVQSFVAEYGEQVLATPPKRGFNLTAWVMPFAGLLVGGGVIYTALKSWVRRGKSLQTNDVHKDEEGEEEYQRRLEKELDEFSGESFR